MLKVTPVDIRNQEFKKSIRGYDPVEVDSFLEILANELEDLVDENHRLQDRILQLETELKNYKEVEKTLKETLQNMQETTVKSKENSLKEADLIKKEAELAATEMIEKARAEVKKMREELITLRTQKEAFAARLRHLLNSQLELLDVLELDDLDISKLKDRTKKVVSGQAEENVGSKPKPKIQPNPGSSTKNSPVEKPTPKKENHSGGGKQGSDFFKDIFGDDIDMDDMLK